jgi:ribosomal protein RSM22 (predicted rRNA methylase)
LLEKKEKHQILRGDRVNIKDFRIRKIWIDLWSLGKVQHKGLGKVNSYWSQVLESKRNATKNKVCRGKEEECSFH